MTNGIPHRGIPFFVADDVRYNFSVYDVVRKGMPTSMRQGFDNEKYIELQAANIRKRIAQFGGKLYLEFGGKLFDDYHASRVLPGFEPDTKFRMLESLVDDVEIVIAINANHIEKGKTRGDLGIPYDEDVLRLIDVFRSRGFLVGSVVLTQYANQPAADAYRHRLEQLGVTCRLHYPIAGYPHDIERIVSDDGYGKNEYIETTRPLVVVTAPGPGSGKLATCLSQLYHEHQRGIDAGYAKYETFPIWNLPLNHPVNIAYEAATVDLDDANIIDPFHPGGVRRDHRQLQPRRRSIPRAQGHDGAHHGRKPLSEPHRHGRQHGRLRHRRRRGVPGCRPHGDRAPLLRCHRASQAHRHRRGPGRAASLHHEEGRSGQGPVARAVGRAAQGGDDRGTGRRYGTAQRARGHRQAGELLGAASALLMNALKAVTGIDENQRVIDESAIEPICRLKTEHLSSMNRRLHSDETLIALSLTSAQSPTAARVIGGLEQLRGCDAFFSVIISSTDEELYRKLGINVCCEPKYERLSLYHK